MSTSLYWAPPPVEPKEHSIGLKHEICRYIDKEWNGDPMDVMAGKELIPFLEGIMSVSTESRYHYAKDLIAAINKYGKVQLYTK